MDDSFKHDRADFALLLARTASALAHDIRAPLRHTGQFLEFYENELAKGNAEAAAEHLEIVKLSLNHTYSMIDALIHYARAGRDLGDPEELDLQKLASTAADRVRLGLDIESVELTFDGPTQAKGHFGPLLELFFQVIENSATYVGKNVTPVITITSTVTDDGVELLIADNGPGIRPGFEDVAFDLFQKVDAEHPSEGPGIGLALSRRIAELHGGALDMAENQPETGLLLRLKLPG